MFSSGTQEVGSRITIGHIGEVMRHWRKIFDKVGFIIFDESQRSPSKILTNLLPNFDCRYVLGLSNTLQRKDRLLKLIHFYLGDVVYSIDEKDAREGRRIIPGTVIARRTDFDYPYTSRADYVSMLQELMLDPERNRKIADDVEVELGKGAEQVLILSGGEEHDRVLGEEFSRRGITVFPYSRLGGVSRMADENGGNNHVSHGVALQAKVLLVSPGALPQFSRTLKSHVVFLAVPVYFQKNLSNAIRDISQEGETADNRLTIYDYVDSRVGILDNYFRMRSYNYGVHPDLLLNNPVEVRESMR